MEKKVVLAASYSVVEPLSLMYLSGVAKQERWKTKIVLVKNNDFAELDKIIETTKPQIVGFSIYTGNHLQAFKYFDILKNKNKKIKIVLGGPHATYFPEEAIKHADYVVLSEGFNAFRKILQGKAKPGILPLVKQEPFPLPQREGFYKDYHIHNNSEIKSVITNTGCPYACTYCYNSSTLDKISSVLSKTQLEQMEKTLGPTKRLFPHSKRRVDSVIKEIQNILKISPQTKLIFFQDDVFGADIEWLKEFTKKYATLKLPFHAQLRFEYANPKNPECCERLELMKKAGCNGLTFAIESADPIIRQEVLNRHMDESLLFDVFQHLNKMGFKVRTEQMLGLPYGATSKSTKINLDADLQLLELNVKLKEKTGLPTIAWAAIFAPYKGTKISEYCLKHGFYLGENEDIPESFFERSVLRFPKKWTGSGLSPGDRDSWLSEKEQEAYRDKMQTLRDLFDFFARIPKGHILAKDFLEKGKLDFYTLSTEARRHVYDYELYGVK
ncbi:MAG: cobalamin-dependent protein [Nanoarchaeota archaeon]|nr:cobalamin-dependent protein [Nanoarchaeota archaeon]